MCPNNGGTIGQSSYLVSSVTTDWQSHSIVLVDTSSDNIILSLPSAELNIGKVYEFKNTEIVNEK